MKDLNMKQSDDMMNKLRLYLASNEMKPFISTFLSLHASDQAAFFLGLSEKNRGKVLNSLNPHEFVGVFQEIGWEDRRLAVTYLDSAYVVEMLNIMVPVEAAAFLKSITRRKSLSLLNAMNPEARGHIERIMKYPVNSSGALMYTEFLTANIKDTVDVVLNKLSLSSGNGNYHHLYVIDGENCLIGAVTIHQLLRAESNAAMETLMSSNIISVHDQTDLTQAADLIKKYNLLELPVTDQEDIMIGIIKIDDVIELMEEQISLSIESFAALRSGISLTSGIIRLVSQRLPWLVGLTVLGLLITKIMAPFLASLEQFTTVSLFIPVILGMSGNSGIQSLSVVLRRISMSSVSDKDSLHLLGREAGIGALTGFVCGLFAFVLANLLLNSSLMFSTIIGLALFIAIFFGTITGAILPLIVKRLSIDPAIASGPVLTTLTDIVALFIYYSVATLLIPLATT